MKLEKATEFYSAYYEGSLEPGIKVQFESALESNPTIAADYAEFVASMEDLGEFAQADVPVPDDLHEQISRRLDRHIFENKQTAKGGWFERFRLQLVGGVAAITLLGSLLFLNQSGKSFSAGIGGDGVGSSVEVLMKDGEAVLSYTPSKQDQLSIFRAGEDHAMKEVPVQAGQKMESMLTNSGPSAETLRIESRNGTPVYVAIPGSKRSTTSEGMGNLVKLAAGMADFFQQPVLLDVRDRDRSVRWAFTAGSATDSKIEGVQLSVSVKNGLIRLRD